MTEAKTITPTVLANELSVDPKRLRAYLRTNYTRSPEAKNTSWTIPADVANEVRTHFTAKAAAKAAS